MSSASDSTDHRPQDDWRPIKSAPHDESLDVWVYQPAVEYEGGLKFPAYVEPAVWQGELWPHKWYAEGINTVLEPTHWMPFERPKPPNRDVVKSKAYAPTGGGLMMGWSSGGIVVSEYE